MLDHTDPLELLAQDSLVPVRFLSAATALGPSMEPGSVTPDLAKDTSLSVPLWMVQALHERNFVEVRQPPVYSERYRRKLNAGAECVSLKSLAPYFYEVGNQLNQVLQDVELSGFLSRTFKTRYHELVSKGLNTMTGEEVLRLASKLSVEEAQLFEGGRLSIAAIEAWWRGDASSEGQSARLPTRQQSLLLKRSAADTAAGGSDQGTGAGGGDPAGTGGKQARR